MSEPIAYAVTASWILAGALFWLGALRHSGAPTHWRARHSRDDGWAGWLFALLPVCLIGGPIWWLALVCYRAVRARSFRA